MYFYYLMTELLFELSYVYTAYIHYIHKSNQKQVIYSYYALSNVIYLTANQIKHAQTFYTY